jgi:hypothetical protein
MILPTIVDGPGKSPRRFRLAWRWKESGVSGSGPWTYRADVVTAWLESMTLRSGQRVEHWIEVENENDGDRLDMRGDERLMDAR